MANLVVGTKAIIKSLNGASAGGFEVGEVVEIVQNDVSANTGRIKFKSLKGNLKGYNAPENLIPLTRAKEGVVKVEIGDFKAEGTVKDVLALLDELVKFNEKLLKGGNVGFDLEKTPEPVAQAVAPQPTKRLGDKIGIGTKIKITGNGHHGELNPHHFKIGDVVEVIGNVGANDLDEVALRAEGKHGGEWTVHQDDFKVHVEVTPTVGMIAVVKDGRGETNCLHGFKDGDIVTITRIDKEPKKYPFAVSKGYARGYAGLEDLELLF